MYEPQCTVTVHVTSGVPIPCMKDGCYRCPMLCTVYLIHIFCSDYVGLDSGLNNIEASFENATPWDFMTLCVTHDGL
jgi:hypothetical protein